MKESAVMPLKIAFITQVVDEDDPVLGFTCGWINAMAKLVERIEVICLRKEKHHLAGNVSVNVMPEGKLRRFFYLRNFLKKAICEKSINAVFAHMCPIYAWTASTALKHRIPLGLWYAHPATSFTLGLAAKSCDVIFTSAEGGFPFFSNKVIITGQGIDTEKFTPEAIQKNKENIRIISVGRLSPVKRYEISVRAIKMLKEKLPALNLTYDIYGPMVTDDSREYSNRLIKLACEYGISEIFKLRGAVLYNEMPKIYSQADIVIDMMHGSLDKSALEACACAVPVIVANKNFHETFGRYADILIANSPTAEAIAEKIEKIISMTAAERNQIGGYLREQVIERHSLDSLMKKIVAKYEAKIKEHVQ